MSTEPTEHSTGIAAAVVRFVTRSYLLILLLFGLASYYSFTVAKTLKLNTSIVALMPEGVPSVENLEKVIEKTGGYSNAMIVVRSPDPDAAVRFLDDLRQRVLALDWVSSAEYAEDIGIFQRNKLLFVGVDDLEEINQRLTQRIEFEKKHLRFEVKDTPVEITIRGGPKSRPPSLDFDDIENKYSGDKKFQEESRRIFRNQAGDITIMVVLPKGETTNIGYSRRILSDLGEQIERLKPASYHPQMSVQIGGRVKNRVAQVDAILSDVSGSAYWSIGGILLVIVLFYRRLLSVVYITVPLVMAFVWTFAVAQMVFGALNLITIFLVLILFGLGVDFGIHNLSRYDEVRRRGGSLETALTMVYTRTGKASLWAAITTIAGFYSLLNTDFRAFYEFGFIAGTGVAFALASMYIVFPALMVLAERVRLYRVPKRKAEVAGPSDRRFPFPYLILAIVAGASVYSGLMIKNLKFEDDFRRLKAEVPAVNRVNEDIQEVFPLRTDRAVVFADTLEDVSALVEEIERIRKERSPETATIEQVKSIYSVVPKTDEQQQRLEIIDRIQDKLTEAIRLLDDFGNMNDERAKELKKLMEYFGVSELKPDNLPAGLQRVYTGVPGSGGYLVYIFNRESMSKLDEAQAFVNDIREIKANGKTFYPATEAIVFVDMLNLMRKDAVVAISAVVIAIVVVLLVAFRSVSRTVLVLLPVAAGMLWMLAIMVLFGIKLNIFNMVVLPTVLGIGIDNGIHIYHRYLEEGGRVWEVVRTTGGSAFLTTLTTMLGFAGMLTASHHGLQSLGLVACIGLGACMVGSLVAFPALLEVLERLRDRRATRAAADS